MSARMKGKSVTGEFVPRIRLVSMSTYPLGTIVSMWIGSRYRDTFSAEDIENLYYKGVSSDNEYVANKLCEYYPEYAGDTHYNYKSVIRNIANLVIKSNLPPLDAINFTFEIDDANVAWREQLVRGRQPQNFWMQTSRTADLSTMDVNRLESIERCGGKTAVEIYDNAVQTIRDAYTMLTDLGVPSEDIRLIPQGMTHRVYWMVPYRTLVGAIGKRVSWIAQASLWTPIIIGIQEELYKNSPFFAEVIGTPPDVKISHGKVISHSYDIENEDRYYGRDYQPVCPLWLSYKGYTMPKNTNIEMYDAMKSMYIKMWNTETCDILGWDKNDPTKLGPYDRPREEDHIDNSLDDKNLAGDIF